MITTREDLVNYSRGMPLLGEIVSWNCSGVSLTRSELVEALKAARLDPDVVAEMPLHSAFNRACKNLGQRRVIRKLAEDPEVLSYQFTSEARESDLFSYHTEAVLNIDKSSDVVSCDVKEIEVAVQKELIAELGIRRAGDLSKIILKLLEQKSALFPIRPSGGVYLVMSEHSDFLDSLEVFTEKAGGRLLRFPFPSCSKSGDQSVKVTIASGLAHLIEDYAHAVEAFGADTKPATLDRAADHIRQARFKVEAYSTYLEDEKSKLDSLLSDVSERLREKVNAIAVGV